MATPSALTNSFVQPGIMAPEMFPDFLETNFQKVNEDLMAAPIQGLKMFIESDTSLDHDKHTALTGFGTMAKNRDSQNIYMDSAIQGFDNTYTQVTFRLGHRFEESLRETGQYGLISKIQRALMQARNDTIEYHAALPFNTTFDAAVTFLCADGMALCDEDRPREDKAGTWSNVDPAAALTENSLEDMDNAFSETVNGRGLLRPLSMRNLVVPRELRRKALELTKSEKAPEDSLNRINVFKGAMDVIVWDYLTDANGWFGTADMTEPNYQLFWKWGQRSNVKTWADGGNCDVTIQRIRMKFAYGADRPHGIRGNQGA